MRHGRRLLAACLLASLLAPRPVQAGGDLGENPSEIGQKLYAKKNFKTALKYFQKALHQRARAGNESKAEIHFWLGEVYMQLKDFGKAEAEYRKAKESF